MVKVVNLKGKVLLFFFCAVTVAVSQQKAPPHPWDKGKIKKIDVSKYPAKHQKAHTLTKQKCGNCHRIQRIYNSTYEGKFWLGVVKRMMVKPGANISKKQAKEIYDFLKYYSTQKK